MFVQYHDIIKPVYLYAVLKMLYTNTTYGMPFSIIKNMSFFSIVEWYMNRRYINPLIALDPNQTVDTSSLDLLLKRILSNDHSIYKLAPHLNFRLLMNACVTQQLSFPVYIYTEEHDQAVEEDAKTLFPGMSVNYLHGPLDQVLIKCDQNFTYIFSDINLLVEAATHLKGSCSHILLAGDYRYNYLDYFNTTKHNLVETASNNPYVRIGITSALDKNALSIALLKSIKGGA